MHEGCCSQCVPLTQEDSHFAECWIVVDGGGIVCAFPSQFAVVAAEVSVSRRRAAAAVETLVVGCLKIAGMAAKAAGQTQAGADSTAQESEVLGAAQACGGTLHNCADQGEYSPEMESLIVVGAAATVPTVEKDHGKAGHPGCSCSRVIEKHHHLSKKSLKQCMHATETRHQ